jgi:hypothetical protein
MLMTYSSQSVKAVYSNKVFVDIEKATLLGKISPTISKLINCLLPLLVTLNIFTTPLLMQYIYFGISSNKNMVSPLENLTTLLFR